MTQDLKKKLKSRWHTFTASEQRIAGYLVQNLSGLPFETAASLGQRVGVSECSTARDVAGVERDVRIANGENCRPRLAADVAPHHAREIAPRAFDAKERPPARSTARIGATDEHRSPTPEPARQVRRKRGER